MLTILIPCAGEGKRFKEKGYKEPKPLIPVNGTPMLKRVIDNVRPEADHRWVFVSRYEDELLPHLTYWFRDGTPFVVLQLDRPTEGAACTCLVAEPVISSHDPLLIVNCDQLVEGGIAPLLETDGDAAILTMERHDDPRWSYVVTKGEWIGGVYEKNPVSDRATTGHYWFRRGKDFVAAAEEMIRTSIRTNGEFYVAPVFNHANILIREVQIESYGGVFHGLGTPEDLEEYLSNHKP